MNRVALPEDCLVKTSVISRSE